MIRKHCLLTAISALCASLMFGCSNPGPENNPGDVLAGVVPSEREAVLQLLRDAGLNAAQLRPVGKLGIAKNRLAIAVAEGHVVGLRVSASSLRSMAAVAALPELSLLWLPNNRITAIDGLEKAHRLTELVLSNNQIANVSGLAGAEALDTLALDGNRISNVQNIPKLQALQTLDLSSNQLGTLDGLEKLVKLSSVRALDNPLVDAEAVRGVRARGGTLLLPESVAAVSHGSNAPRPAGESVSTFVLKLPNVDGKKTGQENFDARTTGRAFEYNGRMKSLTGSERLGLIEGTNSYAEPVTIDMTVASGVVRLYVADLNGYRFVEVRPGQTARITGRLMLGLNYYALLEAREGEARGLEWRVFRK